MRFFNTAGPMIAEDHYLVPPLSRFDLDELDELIARRRYFVLHAPRQTGKTTALFALRDRLNATGRYRCVYANIENAQTAREDVEAGMRAVLNQIGLQAIYSLDDRTVYDSWPDTLARAGAQSALHEALALWAAADSRPLVLFVDEIDALIGDTLVSVLRQLRTGYADRPGRFPQSVILCGVRDVRDYRIHASSEKDPVLGGSAFNVKAKSLRLGDFSEAEVRDLLAQHAEETGQPFATAAVDEMWRLCLGQPWLANALAYEVCFEKAGVRDRTREVTLEDVMAARERLILRRDTHLDQLVHKLEEPRVQRVIEPLLSGVSESHMFRSDDLQYVRDLGLVKRAGPVEIANPIYCEVIPRELTYAQQAAIPNEPAWYVDQDGRLDMEGLMRAFQEFFRDHAEHWVERFQYREAGPQLLLQAFLQRIVNSGGRIEREYGVGRRRMDLAVIWPVGGSPGSDGGTTTGDGTRAENPRTPDPGKRPDSEQRVVVECKIKRGGLEATLREGLPQITDYMDRWGTEDGHMVVFDRTPGKSWSDKLFRGEESHEGRRVTVWGM